MPRDRSVAGHPHFQIAQVQRRIDQDRSNAAFLVFEGQGRVTAGIAWRYAFIAPRPQDRKVLGAIAMLCYVIVAGKRVLWCCDGDRCRPRDFDRLQSITEPLGHVGM